MALALLAASAAARVPALATLGDYSRSAIYRADPTSVITGAAAAVVRTVVLTGASALEAARDLHALLELARAAR